MYSMHNILSAALNNLGIKKKFNAQSVIVHWRQIAGEEIAARSHPVKIERGVMLLAVSNSVWCHHLMMLKESIVSKVNEFIGEKLISDIRFQAGYFKNCQNEGNSIADEENIKKQLSVSLSQQEFAETYSMVNTVRDENLREKLRKLKQKDLVLKKLRSSHEWHKCATCSVLCPPGQKYCTVCGIARKQQIIDKIRMTLIDAPWLKYQDLIKYVNCTPDEYDQAKQELTARLSIEFYTCSGQFDKVQATTLAMLTTCLTPESITEEILQKTLEKIRRKKYVSTPRR